jgi:hypothetical protein
VFAFSGGSDVVQNVKRRNALGCVDCRRRGNRRGGVGSRPHPGYEGEALFGYYFGSILGFGLVAGLVTWLLAMGLGLALRRKVGVFGLLAVLAAAILVPAAPALFRLMGNEVFNGDLAQITDMAANTYAAQDRAYDTQIRAVDFNASINVRGLAADPGYKILREKIQRARKLMDDYRAQVRNRRTVMVATLDKKHVSAARQAEYLAAFDADMAKTRPEMEVLWELEDSFLIEVGNLVDLLERARPEWDVKRELVIFNNRADLNTLQTYMKRLKTLSEEMERVRTQAVIVSSQPASRPAGRD